MRFPPRTLIHAFAGTGQWSRARTALNEASQIWQELGNLPMLSETLMRIHWTDLATGDYDQAIAYAQEAFRLGRDCDNLDAQALSRFMIGFVYWERGQPQQALATMMEAVTVAESVASLTPSTGTRADLGWVYGQLGAVDRGLELAHLALSTAEEKLPILRFWPRAILVSLHLLNGDLAAAERVMAPLEDYRQVRDGFGYMPFMWIRVALAQGEFAFNQQDFACAAALMDDLDRDLRQAGIHYLRPDALHLKARALLKQGSNRAEEVRTTLERARAEAKALGSRRSLWPILMTLGDLQRHFGDRDQAQALQRQAGEILDYIARHIETPELRTSFLGLPQVAAVLRAWPGTKDLVKRHVARL